MEHLNDYCLLYIFRHFSPRDRLIASKVCSKWNNLMYSCWRESKLTVIFQKRSNKEANNYIDPSDFREIMQFCGPVLKKIHLIPLFDKLDYYTLIQIDAYTYRANKLTIFDVLNILTEVCYNVESLKICLKEDYPTDLLNKLLSSNERLQKLEIDGEYITYLDDIVQLEKLPTSLEQMILSFVYFETDNSLCSFLEQASNLNELKLVEGNLITYRLLQTISVHTTQLKVLQLEQDNEEDEISISAVKNISKLINLEEFSIKGFGASLTDDAVIEISACCTKIKELSLSNCSSITNKGIDICISSLPELQILELKNLNISVLSPCNIPLSLKKLKLYRCNNSSDDAMCKMIQTMLYLKNLEIHCFRHICKKIIYFAISTAISRNQSVLVTEDISSNKERHIIISRFSSLTGNEIYPDNSIFCLRCYPQLDNLLQIIQDHIRNTMSEYKISHEIKDVPNHSSETKLF